MKMSELIAAVGDDIVGVQNLDNCATNLNWSQKGGTKITFGTDVALKPDGTEKLGIIIWLPRDKVKQVMDQQKKGAPR